jgi:hypothetical protein
MCYGEKLYKASPHEPMLGSLSRIVMCDIFGRMDQGGVIPRVYTHGASVDGLIHMHLGREGCKDMTSSDLGSPEGACLVLRQGSYNNGSGQTWTAQYADHLSLPRSVHRDVP